MSGQNSTRLGSSPIAIHSAVPQTPYQVGNVRQNAIRTALITCNGTQGD